MKIIDSIKRSGRNLKASKLRTALTALAISIGGLTLTLTLAAASGAQAYSNKLVSANFDPKSVFVAKDKEFFGNRSSAKPKEYSTDLSVTRGTLVKQFDSKDVATIKALPHIAQVIENYTLNAEFITRQGAKSYTGAINVYDSAQKPQIKAGQAPSILSNNQVLLPDDYLALLNFTSADQALGKVITIQVQQLAGKSLAKNYTVVGITTKSSLSIGFDAVGPYVSDNEAGQLNNFINSGTILADRVPTVTVRGDGITADALKAELQTAGFEARTAKDLQSLISQIINVLQAIILVFGLITLIASFFGVTNTQYISVLERTREIGLMKALGMSRRTVSRLFIIEAAWIGFIGALFGSAVALGIGTALNPWISKQINFGSDRLLVFKPLEIAGLIIFLVLVTTIAGLLPARKAAKLDPIDALRTE